MATRFFTVLLLTSCLPLACSRNPQPSTSEIEQALTSNLPAFAEISSFSVDAMQNMGTQVEPVWQSRFHATVKVTSATFTPDGTDSGVVFVRAVKQAGEKTELFGKSVSTLYAGKWRTALDLEGRPIEALGRPESAFGPEKVIVRGSKTETAYIAEQADKRRLAIVGAQREAEARAGAQREAEAAAQRALQEQDRENVATARTLIGSWRDENSVCTYSTDGVMAVRADDGTTGKVRWSVSNGYIVGVWFERNGRPFSATFRNQIVALTSSNMTIRESTGETWHSTRVINK